MSDSWGWGCLLCGQRGNQDAVCGECGASDFNQAEDYFFAGVPLTEMMEEEDQREKKRMTDEFKATMRQYYQMKYRMSRKRIK
jgi:hypothetical protein